MVTIVTAVALAAAAVWARVEVVENTAEGPASARCELDGQVDGRPLHWRVFYGEVRADADRGWTAIRPRAGCAEVASEAAPGPWTLRGSPYLLVDIDLARADGVPGAEATIALRRLTGFGDDGAAVYARTVEKRTLAAGADGHAVVPIPFAGRGEAEKLGLRELLLRFQTLDFETRPPAAYGALAVSADEPRATVLLDGGAVARIADDGPVVLRHVTAGEHTVAIRDASGREVRRKVRVAKGERTKVALTLLPPRSPADPAGFRTLGTNPEGGEELWREKDGAIVVRIPAGAVRMGSPPDEGEPAERPQHVVRLPALIIDKTEVTWGQYRRFAEETGHALPKAPIWGMPESVPVSNVTWADARAFCTWVGGRLPTEAEWERAARGDDTRRYPWGDDWDPARCNTRDGGPHALMAAAANPACTSPWGVLDLAGNVWEWCEDWFDGGYYARSPSESPKGPETGELRVSRGGSWINPSFSARVAVRQGTDPQWPDTLRGFRCAGDDPVVSAEPSPPAASATTAPTAPAMAGEQAPRPRLRTWFEQLGGPGRRDGERCRAPDGAAPGALQAWATFGAAKPGADGFEVEAAAVRCGAGVFPDPSTATQAATAPLAIFEVAATPGMDAGAMDPGPGRTFQAAITLRSRRLTGFSPEGIPVYGEDAVNHRLARLATGDEFVLPVRVEGAAPAVAVAPSAGGSGLVLVGLQSAEASSAGATAYGSILVTAAAPSSPIVLDGGEIARAGSDGSFTLADIPIGTHEIELRAGDGRAVSRPVRVYEGRTAVASAAAAKPIGFVDIGKNEKGFPRLRRVRDGADMIRIPEGEFLMGNLATEGSPQPHTVRLSTYLIDELPVTVARYEQFAAATGRPLPPEPYWGRHGDHPVVYVTWDEARAYCEWAGARLPTEAEREKAARGTDGRLFPWGNEEPSPERGVFRRNWGYEGTDPVGRRPAGVSPYGLHDAGGNVWEWVQDWHDPDYYASSPAQDPQGPSTGRARVLRGGSWDSRPTVLSASSRNYGYVGYREGDFGFRCAADHR